MLSLPLRAAILSGVLLAVLLGAWELATQAPAGSVGARVPGPSKLFAHAPQELSDPFYDAGPNDKGIGIQLAYSVGRVLAGYSLAALLAIPFGFVIGMSPMWRRALDPYIQVLKPISPLAWMPLALYIIKDSATSSLFVLFICPVWPILLNPACGVASVHRPDGTDKDDEDRGRGR